MTISSRLVKSDIKIYCLGKGEEHQRLGLALEDWLLMMEGAGHRDSLLEEDHNRKSHQMVEQWCMGTVPQGQEEEEGLSIR